MVAGWWSAIRPDTGPAAGRQDSLMESVECLQGLPGWVNLLIAAGLVVAGIVITLVLRGSKRAPVRAAEENLPGVGREVQKTIARLESDNAALSHLFQLIPGFTKKMNS